MTKQKIKIAGFVIIIVLLGINAVLVIKSINVARNGRLVVLENIPKGNVADQAFNKLSIGTEFSDAQLVIASDLDRGDIMTLYGAKDSVGPLWRWNNAGGAFVRTWLEITGDHMPVNIGEYSTMLKVRSDLSAGHPAIIVQTNPYEQHVGPLILGFDWDETLTLSIQADGSIQSAGVLQTDLQGDLEGEKTMYSALVGPEVGLYVRGTANLVDGKTTIILPDHFSKFASDFDLTVHLAPLYGWLQIYVANKTTKNITVLEASGKSGEFDYVVYGVRKGYENYLPTEK